MVIVIVLICESPLNKPLVVDLKADRMSHI